MGLTLVEAKQHTRIMYIALPCCDFSVARTLGFDSLVAEDSMGLEASTCFSNSCD